MRKTFFLSFHSLKNGRQSSDDQTDKQEVYLNRIILKQPFNDKGKSYKSDHCSNAYRDQYFKALFKLFAYMCECIDDLIVNSHRNRQGPSAYPGNDIGNPDQYPPTNLF